MASDHDIYEKGLAGADVESESDKGQADHVDVEDSAIVASSGRLVSPEFIRNMTPEQREKLEAGLRRKIDLRLMPMIILMYLLNYLDRVSISPTISICGN
jgi:hypothetical protein